MLHFLAGLVLVVLFVALLIGSPAFRMACLLVLLVAGGGLYLLTQQNQKSAERYARQRALEAAQEAEKWRHIRPEGLTVLRAHLGSPVGENRNIVLDIRNPNSFTVSNVQVRAKLFDCPLSAKDIDASCHIIGDAEKNVRVEIPPAQTRQLTSDFQFKNVPTVGGILRWSFQLTAVRAF